MTSHPVVDISVRTAIPSHDAFALFIDRLLMTLPFRGRRGTLLGPFCTELRCESKFEANDGGDCAVRAHVRTLRRRCRMSHAWQNGFDVEVRVP